MGYYTRFKMTIVDKDGVQVDREHPAFKTIATEFARIWDGKDFNPENYAYHYDRLDTFFEDMPEYKWYDHDRDMTLLAARFPEFKFALEGEGEEKSDWWVHWWEDGMFAGKSCAKVIEPDFPDWSDGLYFA